MRAFAGAGDLQRGRPALMLVINPTKSTLRGARSEMLTHQVRDMVPLVAPRDCTGPIADAKRGMAIR